jgi:hypothetical protein
VVTRRGIALYEIVVWTAVALVWITALVTLIQRSVYEKIHGNPCSEVGICDRAPRVEPFPAGTWFE